MKKTESLTGIVSMAMAAVGRLLRKLWAGIQLPNTFPPKRRKGIAGRSHKRKARFFVRRKCKKPKYRVAAPGTTWLIDGANVLGVTGPEHAQVVFSTLERTMTKRGYKVAIFLERRCLHWAVKNQASEADMRELKNYAKSAHITLVDNESDLSMLQAARVIPGAVMVTRDHFRDYRATFNDVFTTHKIAGFSCMKTDVRLVMSIFGLKDAIEIPLAKSAPVVTDGVKSVVAEKDTAAKPDQMRKTAKVGLLAWGERCVKHGEIEKAIACYNKLIGKKDAAGYRALAGLYEGKDPARSKKYENLADRLERRMKKSARRDRRISKERIRMRLAA